MSKFWQSYAAVNDDIRHKLVEEAWFGRQVTEGSYQPKETPEAGQVQSPKTQLGIEPVKAEPVSKFYDGPSVQMEESKFYGSPAQPHGPPIEAPKITPATPEPSGPEPEL